MARLLPFFCSSLSSRLTASPHFYLRSLTTLPLVHTMTDPVESGKRIAAHQAVDEYILPHHKAVGIGSGSTVVYALERILQKPELHHIVFIPTSFQSKILIIDGGLKLGSIEQYTDLDVTIDGADEVDAKLNAIKGGGACQFQEKLVAEAAKKFVIIADYRKKSEKLGTQWLRGVPIEVIPMSYKAVQQALQTRISAKPETMALRMAKMKAGPVVTDNGCFVIDAHFGPIADPKSLLRDIKLITGVVEVGLFCGMAEVAFFGMEDGNVSVLRS
ncbi:ribose 5-phosphate isomerase A-domain-containing protein [Jimgerdemannia flammicorona]|uniref:Ribose-5-phosphate isomerase n=1 Tax=Jimgerdemannia flammicorona TaxID=994334 RepID=A0A433A1T5_9FUNG|nr:ribose 5-phosphate isomerase A-domain-containing protein [Jimgerdemannia flammicorona]